MLKIYNSLTRKVEEIKPINPPNIGMYTCGPTVYDFAHIGNFRTYVLSDLLLRTLEYNNLNVKSVMNITDVGHLTGDNFGDADMGEDRMEKAASKERKSAWDIAKFYEKAFLTDFESLNLIKPSVMPKATDHIKEQIELIGILEKKGYTYQTTDGVYFDTSKFKDYGALSTLDEIKEGARVEVNPEKKNPRDFALWKFSPENEKRQMEWDSPWGKGFPGWHIECSAMSMKYLGESFDIHVGGMDLRSTHHPNEIAQSEAATGKPFVNYWVHGAFVLVDNKRMSKSLGNNYRVEDITKNGFNPLALRYLYLQTHYRQEMNFTWEALEASHKALERLREAVGRLDQSEATSSPSLRLGVSGREFEQKFQDAINNDLNMSQALSVVNELLRSDNPASFKAQSLIKFDKVLGLNLWEAPIKELEAEIPEEIQKMVKEREELRAQKRFHLSDQLRNKIRKLGYETKDIEDGGTEVSKIPSSSLK
ncbi:MAG TPA: cysteine--tRNA ligase [Patescibacteria group bacterium]|nr:cysteine--tRNA ligase [Patescibacteria group bacterium]